MADPQLRIRIDLDNAAFDEDAAGEVARILADIASQFDSVRMSFGRTWVTVKDSNGNTVGAFRVTT